MLLLEVMDKMPPAGRVLAVGFAVGVVGFALVRRWPWAALSPVWWRGQAQPSTRIPMSDRPFGGKAAELYALPVAHSAVLAIVLPLVGLLAAGHPYIGELNVSADG
jgi:hypothetical protein